MYCIVKVIEVNNQKYFSMLSWNGTYVDDNIQKAIIFSTAALATKQKEVIEALNPDDTFVVKQIVLQDLNS
jgi:hypothetical protein